ncbi:TPA: hypothetical protein ACH3X2_002629 [Trebouxia sp. C0005]
MTSWCREGPTQAGATRHHALHGLHQSLVHRQAEHSTVTECFSFWQPVAPPGYLPLGHVSAIGLDPLADTVLVYRNDSEKGSRPSNGGSPVTKWELLPPQSYRALGTVAVPDAEQPGSKEVLCIREDLCAKTGICDSPIWKFEPPTMQLLTLQLQSK